MFSGQHLRKIWRVMSRKAKITQKPSSEIKEQQVPVLILLSYKSIIRVYFTLGTVAGNFFWMSQHHWIRHLDLAYDIKHAFHVQYSAVKDVGWLDMQREMIMCCVVCAVLQSIFSLYYILEMWCSESWKEPRFVTKNRTLLWQGFCLLALAGGCNIQRRKRAILHFSYQCFSVSSF